MSLKPGAAMHPEFEGTSDDQLAALALEGSKGAMEELYERHRGAILGYAFRMTGDRVLAEDVFQNTFIYFFEHLDRYEGRGKLGAYLFRIAHSLATDEKISSRRARTAPPGRTFLYSAPVPEDQAEAAAREEKVRAAMEKLPEHLREVVELRIYQGLDYAAVASVTGVSEPTARSRMRYALEALRDTLGVVRRPEKQG